MFHPIIIKIITLSFLAIYSASVIALTHNRNIFLFVILIIIHIIKDLLFYLFPLNILPVAGNIITAFFLILWIDKKIKSADAIQQKYLPKLKRNFFLFNCLCLSILGILIPLYQFSFTKGFSLTEIADSRFFLNSYALANMIFVYYQLERIKLSDIFTDIDEFENLSRKKLNGVIFLFLIFPVIVSFFLKYNSVIMMTFISPFSYFLYAAVVFYHLRIFIKEDKYTISYLKTQVESLYDFMKDIGKLIRTNAVITDIYTKITNSAIENLNADAAAILMIDEKDNMLHVKSLTGYFPPPYETDDYVSIKRDYLKNLFVSAPINPENTIFEYSLKNNESLFIKNTNGNKKFIHNRQEGTKLISSIIILPISVFNKTTGVFAAVKTEKNSYFSNTNYFHSKIFLTNACLMIENYYSYVELFNKTVELTESNRKIDEYNKNLQKMVEERTEQLVKSEKLASLGGLVAGVAHEINTPIGIGITATSHLQHLTEHLLEKYKENQMKRDDLEKYTHDNVESLDIIGGNLKRAAELVNSFKQVAVDRNTDTLKEFNLKQFFEDLIISTRSEFKNTNHKIETICPEDISINSLPGKLSQVIINLMLNSLKHGFENIENGKIVIDNKIEKDNDDDNVKKLFIVYSDNGCGIPTENMSKIWDPFFTTKRAHGGTGLGLNIVYNIVFHNLHGEISCNSKVGEGTTFTIKLPLRQD